MAISVLKFTQKVVTMVVTMNHLVTMDGDDGDDPKTVIVTKNSRGFVLKNNDL